MADAAEENGVDLTNKQKVTEYLRSQVSVSFSFAFELEVGALVGDATEKRGTDLPSFLRSYSSESLQVMECVAEANAQWDERNTGGSQSASQPARPKPLIRLRVRSSSLSLLPSLLLYFSTSFI